MRPDTRTNDLESAAAYERANTYPPDLPDASEVVEEPRTVRDPNTRLCIAAWVSHDRPGWVACPHCNPQISTLNSQNGSTA